MVESILPYYRDRRAYQKILFVGVRRYTRSYPKMFPSGEFLTIDNDPAQTPFGSDNHICDDIRNLTKWTKQFPEKFDAIIMNGVIGFGLNDKRSVDETIEILRQYLNETGHLILGTNPRNPLSVPLSSVEVLNQNFVPVKFDRHDQYTIQFVHHQSHHEYSFYEHIRGAKHG